MPRSKKGITHRLPKPHPETRRWRLRIGLAHAQDDPRRHVEKVFWWPRDCNEGEMPPPSIIADAVAKQDQWRQIEKCWPSLRPRLEDAYPNADWSVPVWYDPKLLERADAEIDAEMSAVMAAREREMDRAAADDADAAARWVAANGLAALVDRLRQPLDLDLPAIFPEKLRQQLAAHAEEARVTALHELEPARRRATIRPITVEQAIDEFLADQQKRVDLKTGSSIRAETYRGLHANLLVAFGLSTGKERTRLRDTTIDRAEHLTAINRERLVRFARFWQSLPEGIDSSHTVKNYFSAVRSFLRWCEVQDQYGFSAPKGLNDILTADSVATKAVPFEPDKINKILSHGGKRLRLYAAFGLLLGYGPKDIAMTRTEEVFEERGEHFVKRERSKESGGSRRKRRGERVLNIKHWIAPEMIADINRFAQPENPYGLLLLSQAGTPLYSFDGESGSKSSVVADQWRRACRKAGIRLSFKQLRKMGYNRIKCYAESREVSEIWDGHSAAIGDHYDDGVFEPVIAAQRLWADELRATGILRASNMPAKAVPDAA